MILSISTDSVSKPLLNVMIKSYRYSDTFVILVAHYLYDLFLEENDFKFIKDSICLLEYAYDNSPSNHHFKLLLLKFYNILGKIHHKSQFTFVSCSSFSFFIIGEL